jgi:hypothetical protein
MRASRRSRRPPRNKEQNPKTSRSAGWRLGARRRDRRRTNNCRLSKRFSASTALIPRLPRSLVRPAKRCRINHKKCFMPSTLTRKTIQARTGDSDAQRHRISNSPCTRWRGCPSPGPSPGCPPVRSGAWSCGSAPSLRQHRNGPLPLQRASLLRRKSSSGDVAPRLLGRRHFGRDGVSATHRFSLPTGGG